MSVIEPGDEALHYSDNSHRWLCPDGFGNEDAWADRVRTHMEAHRLFQDERPPQRRNPSAGPKITGGQSG